MSSRGESARLKSRADFDRVFSRGRSVSSANLVLRVWERGDDSPARFGWVIGRQVGTAVVRNRLRRRLQGIFLSRDWPRGFDCVVAVKSAEIRDLSSEVDGLLEESGLLRVQIEHRP